MRFEVNAVTGLENELRLRTSFHIDTEIWTREDPTNPFRSIILLESGVVLIVDEPFDDLVARMEEFESEQG